MGGRCAVGAAAAVWCGLLLGAGAPPAGAGAALALSVPFAALAWRGPDRVGTVALLVALALAGAARAGAHGAALERARGLVGAGGLCRIEGRVATPPAVASGEPVMVVAVRSAHPPLAAGTRVRLRLPAGERAEWSDRVEVLARIGPPSVARNPGGYDARAAADAAGLAAVGRAHAVHARPAPGPAAWPRVTVARWRRAIERRLEARLAPETLELAAPLVTGDRTAVSPDLNSALRASGLIHLLALSGLHVAWMAAVARFLAGAARGGPRARAAAGALAALVYAGIAGPLPSLARAAATEAVHSLARLLGRASDPIQALALSALALLVVAPGWARDTGFQLSCAATLGLVAIGPALPGERGRLRLLRAALVPTASAQLGALPILLGRFHAVPWLAPVANLAAVPIAALLLAAAWIALVADALVPGLGGPWFAACEALGAALRAVADGVSRAPLALPGVGAEPGVAALAAVGAGLLALACAGPRDLDSRAAPVSRARLAAGSLGGVAAGLSLVLAATARPLLPPPGRAWTVVLDVGQGDAIALGFPEGWWLVDAGPRSPRHDAGESVVLPFLRWAGVRRLEGLILTHDDADHTGGAAAVLRGIPVRRVWAPTAAGGVPGPARRFGAAAAARGGRIGPARVLWPPRDPAASDPAIRSDNAASLILEIGEGPARTLLLGDADSTVEAVLEVEPGVGLLKVAHHGARSSSGAGFLARARPRAAAISCGRLNPFGHPDAGALARLRRAGAAIHRTDEAGALWFEAGPGGPRRVDWRAGRPAPAGAGPAARPVSCTTAGRPAR